MRSYIDGYQDLSTYCVEKVDCWNTWDDLSSSFKDNSIYWSSNYLRRDNLDVKLFKILKRNEPRAVFVLPQLNENTIFVPNNFIYNGLVFLKPNNNQNYAQSLSEEFRITAFFLNYLIKNYKSIQLSLSPTVTDIRPFSWVNFYGQANVQFEPKFTAKIDLRELERIDFGNLPQNFLYLQFNKSRRQALRNALKEDLVFTEVGNFLAFEQLYNTSMAKISNNSRLPFDEIKNYLKQLQSVGKIRIFEVKTSSLSTISCAVIGVHERNAFYLHGANAPENRSTNAGTLLIWKILEKLHIDGCESFDLEGVNSPKRGYFKLSFGARLVRYDQFNISSVEE